MNQRIKTSFQCSTKKRKTDDDTSSKREESKGVIDLPQGGRGRIFNPLPLDVNENLGFEEDSSEKTPSKSKGIPSGISLTQDTHHIIINELADNPTFKDSIIIKPS